MRTREHVSRDASYEAILLGATDQDIKRRKVAAIGLAAFACFAVVGSVTAIFHDSAMDILGDSNTDLSRDEVQHKIDNRSSEIYEQQSVNGRYALLLLGTHRGYGGQIIVRGDNEVGNGILGLPSEKNVEVDLGQSCLAGSSFDTRPSEIRGRAAGDISSTATINVTEEGVVRIHPASTDAEPISFNQSDNSRLTVHDDYTRNTLNAYGCNTELPLITSIDWTGIKE